MKTTVSVEREDEVVLLLVTRTNGDTGNSHSEGIRIPYDSVEVAHQLLGEILASSATETENGGIVCYCGESDVYDGYADCPVHPRGGVATV